MATGYDIAEVYESQAEEAEASRLAPAEADGRLPGDAGEVEIIGHPDEMSRYYHQQEGAAECAPVAQEAALEAAGKPYDIDETCQAGAREGWFDPETGTTPADVGHVWERAGLTVERYGLEEADGPADLTEAGQAEAYDRLESNLESGKAVVALVDSGPLWDDFREPADRRGHAVWVTGVEHSREGTLIICNDSGFAEGKEIAYPFARFDSAWQAKGYEMISTRDPILAR